MVQGTRRRVALSVLGAGSRMPRVFEGGLVSIGSDPSCDLCVEGARISPRHLIIQPREEGEGHEVLDLRSEHGTRVNGRVVTACDLRVGDVIEVGDVRLRFDDPARVAASPEPPPAVPDEARDGTLPRVIARRDLITRRWHCECPGCTREIRLMTPDLQRKAAGTCPKCGTHFVVTTKKLERRREPDPQDARDAEVTALRQAGFRPPDNITILGRPQSGKSVYLSVLYKALYESEDDLRGRVLDGPVHQALLEDHQTLASGHWLPPTSAVRDCDVHLSYRGIRLTLSTRDYPGEVFRRVFFQNQVDTPEAQELLGQVRDSMGILLLVDPEEAARRTPETADVEFTCVQVVEHLQEQGREDCCTVLLTKRDRNAELVDGAGGPRAFLARYLPHLNRTAPDLRVEHVASVSSRVDGNGGRIPHVDGAELARVRQPLWDLIGRVPESHLVLLRQQQLEAGRGRPDADVEAEAEMGTIEPPPLPPEEAS